MRCVLKIRQHAVLATSVKLQGTLPTTGLVAQCSFNGTYQILSQTAMVALPFVLCSTLFSFGMAKNFPHPATLCFCSFSMKFPSFERKWFGCSPTTSTWNLQHGSHNVFPVVLQHVVCAPPQIDPKLPQTNSRDSESCLTEIRPKILPLLELECFASRVAAVTLQDHVPTSRQDAPSSVTGSSLSLQKHHPWEEPVDSLWPWSTSCHHAIALLKLLAKRAKARERPSEDSYRLQVCPSSIKRLKRQP